MCLVLKLLHPTAATLVGIVSGLPAEPFIDKISLSTHYYFQKNSSCFVCSPKYSFNCFSYALRTFSAAYFASKLRPCNFVTLYALDLV